MMAKSTTKKKRRIPRNMTMMPIQSGIFFRLSVSRKDENRMVRKPEKKSTVSTEPRSERV